MMAVTMTMMGRLLLKTAMAPHLLLLLASTTTSNIAIANAFTTSSRSDPLQRLHLQPRQLQPQQQQNSINISISNSNSNRIISVSSKLQSSLDPLGAPSSSSSPIDSAKTTQRKKDLKTFSRYLEIERYGKRNENGSKLFLFCVFEFNVLIDLLIIYWYFSNFPMQCFSFGCFCSFYSSKHINAHNCT